MLIIKFSFNFQELFVCWVWMDRWSVCSIWRAYKKEKASPLLPIQITFESMHSLREKSYIWCDSSLCLPSHLMYSLEIADLFLFYVANFHCSIVWSRKKTKTHEKKNGAQNLLIECHYDRVVWMHIIIIIGKQRKYFTALFECGTPLKTGFPAYTQNTNIQPISTFMVCTLHTPRQASTMKEEKNRMRAERRREKKTHESMILLHLIILMDTSLLLWRYENTAPKTSTQKNVLSKANSSNKVTSGYNL